MVTEDERHRGQHLASQTSPLTWLLVGCPWHSPNSPDSDRIQTFPGFINFDVPNLHSRQRRIRQWSDPGLIHGCR
jgi:hypothetical protein